MKVLLIQDVDNLGYAGDVKKVANGYGRNYLLPQKLAILATPGALKQSKTIRKVAETRRAREMEDAQAISNQLADLELLFERRSGETGKLYGSVTSAEIAGAIEAASGITIDKRKVALPEPIRNLGEQEVTIKLMIDVAATVKVQVLPLGGILERERLTEAEEAQLETEATGAAAAAETEPPSAEAPADEASEASVPAGETEPPSAEAPADEASQAPTPTAETEPSTAEAPADEASQVPTPTAETEPSTAETPAGEATAETEAEVETEVEAESENESEGKAG